MCILLLGSQSVVTNKKEKIFDVRQFYKHEIGHKTRFVCNVYLFIYLLLFIIIYQFHLLQFSKKNDIDEKSCNKIQIVAESRKISSQTRSYQLISHHFS